ncbi:MAG TPA: hypothetical protein VF867_12770 [Arthrobacter sp.]
MTRPTTRRAGLITGQAVHVRLGRSDLGVGRVDDRTEDGAIVWIFFGGATPRRMFMADDPAEFTVLEPGARGRR